MTSLARRPEATGYSVERIVAEAIDGKIRIPKFQRPLRWKATHVIALFDSIRRGFPIGELLLARREAKAERISIGPVGLDAVERSDGLWVVDGQQRITTLVASLSRADIEPTGDMWAIWYDLLKSTFHRNNYNPANVPATWIPLTVTLDSAKLMRWCMDNLMQRGRAEYFDEAVALGKAIREFQIPAYIVEGADEGALRLIFTRSNSSGVPMKESEVFDALYRGHSDHPVQDAVKALMELGWGDIDHELFLRCMKLIHNNQKSTAETLAADLKPGVVEPVAGAFRIAIDVLRHAGFRHQKLLPYRLPLIAFVLLAHRFGEPSPRARRLGQFWAWRGSLTGDLDKSNHAAAESIKRIIDNCGDWETALTMLLRELSPVASLQKHEATLEHDPRGELDREMSMGRATVKMYLIFLQETFIRYENKNEITAQTDVGETMETAVSQYTSPWPQRPILLRDAVLGNWQSDLIESDDVYVVEYASRFALNADCVRSLRVNDVESFRLARGVLLKEMLTDFLDQKIGADDELRPSIKRIIQTTPTSPNPAL